MAQEEVQPEQRKGDVASVRERKPEWEECDKGKGEAMAREEEGPERKVDEANDESDY